MKGQSYVIRGTRVNDPQKGSHGSYMRHNSLNLAVKRTMKSGHDMPRNSVSLEAPMRPKTFATAALTWHSSDAGWESMKVTWYGV